MRRLRRLAGHVLRTVFQHAVLSVDVLLWGPFVRRLAWLGSARLGRNTDMLANSGRTLDGSNRVSLATPGFILDGSLSYAPTPLSALQVLTYPGRRSASATLLDRRRRLQPRVLG